VCKLLSAVVAALIEAKAIDLSLGLELEPLPSTNDLDGARFPPAFTVRYHFVIMMTAIVFNMIFLVPS